MTIIKNKPVFPYAEYIRRLNVVKAAMREKGVETLAVLNQSNITYLTGYASQSAYVPQALIVTMSEEVPTFLCRPMDAASALFQTFLPVEKIIGYPESLVGSEGIDGHDAIIDFILDIATTNRTVGVELGELNSAKERKFLTRLSTHKVVDCTKMVTWIRLIKSDLEIVLMREAAAIADAAIMRAEEVIRPGVREADVMAEVAATLARGVNGKCGTDLTSMFLCSSPRTGAAHIPWSEDVLRPDSQVNIEVGGVRHTYTSAIMRTFSIGKPSDRLRRIHEAQFEGLQAALDVVKPGNTCSDVAEAFYNTLAKYDLKKESRCGYPIGIDWLEPTASLKVGDTTELKPNMCFHLMLGNWQDVEFGYVISESFRVSDTGVEVLTKAPRKLFEI
nr:Xaa-Pro peptidase family protein [uncultured Pseudomonas sp.]